MSRIRLSVLALGAVVLAASGCGGSSKTRSAATPATTAPAATPPPAAPMLKLASGTPLTRAEWIAKGDAICNRSNIKISSVTVRAMPEYATALPQIVTYERAEAHELSKLVPPASMAHDWAQIVNGLQLDSNYISTLAGYARENKYSNTNPLVEKANSLHKQIAELAKRDGFTRCSITRMHSA